MPGITAPTMHPIPVTDYRGPHLIRLIGGPHDSEQAVIWAAASDHMPSTVERLSHHGSICHYYRLNDQWTGRHIVVDNQALPVYEWVEQ